MPGTITFKPLAASLQNVNKKAEPYCTFTMGDQRAEGKASGIDSSHPHWQDAITFKVLDQPKCVVELKDQKNKSAKGFIGNFEIDLHEVESNGKLRKWFTVLNNDKSAGEILLEASYTNEGNQLTEESQKAPQGTVPSSLDLEKNSQEFVKRSMESENSTAKIAETNEFGDYNPEKQLFSGDVRHERGSGMIQQGNYYSGQQTSYGEAYPMTHKSTAFDNVMTIEEYGNTVVPRGSNPTDYARYQNQAFVPHKKEISDLPNNSSVVEKALYTAQRDDLYKYGATTPSPKVGNQIEYRANEGTNLNFYATEKALDERQRDFDENTPISGKTFGNSTQASSRRKESLSDIIAKEKDISKGVGQPTPHGNPGDPDSFHNAFRDIKNTYQQY